jgi:hypothetical protein
LTDDAIDEPIGKRKCMLLDVAGSEHGERCTLHGTPRCRLPGRRGRLVVEYSIPVT